MSKDKLYEKLNELYVVGEYQEYLDLFNENMVDSFKIGFIVIFRYAESLVQLHRFEEGYKIFKKLENHCITNEDKIYLAYNYYYCGKCEDALRILNGVQVLEPMKFYLLAKIYLFKGEIYEAKQYIKYIFHYYPDSEYARKCYYLMKKIKNNAFKGSFIETGYEYFIESGQELEPGNLVYIKDPKKLNVKYLEKDNKDYKRPYLIWKIDGNDIYMSPVTHVHNKYRYAMFLQDYPNSKYERYIINTYCTTTKDNIYSVCDKLKDNELDRVIEYLQSGMYFNEIIDDESKKTFYDLVNGEIDVGDIVVYCDDFSSRNLKTFYIAGELDDMFLGYMLNPITFEIIDDTTYRVDKNIIVKQKYKKQDDGSVVRLIKKAY